MIEARNVEKSYRQGEVTTAALRGVSLAIKDGEQVAITGPSGSGKSTLLALIGALDRPTSGELIANGVSLSTLGPAQRARFRFEQVGFVFQEFHLLPHLTVLENVLAPFTGRPKLRARRRQNAVALLDQVSLGALTNRPASVLSGGEKQRVAIARALVNDPGILLCDEPTGNLDQANGQAVKDLLVEFAREGGKTLIVVTHDGSIASRFPRQIRMQDGGIVGEVG